MSSKEFPNYNDSRKSVISSSNHNQRNQKEKISTSRKVSFFNQAQNQAKNSNNRYYADISRNINEEDSDEIDSNLSSDSYDEDREKQLEIVNEKFQNLFKSKDKLYGNIIKEITAEKKLFFKKSIMSFNLLVLKIQCLIKILKQKFVESLVTKDYYEVDKYIYKIKRDFKNLYIFINEESPIEYELVTQVYAKFLYLLGIISNRKEEYITSFSYISLGVNILKVFFIRRKIAYQIDTYRIYAKLVVMLINKLLSDNNIYQALLYISLLTRICEIGFNIVSQDKNLLSYEVKFNKYQSYGFLYLGFCYELINKNPNDYKIALKAYKEAFYFMNKTPNKRSIFSQLSSVITIEKKAVYLAQILFEKLTEKLTLEALEKQKEFEQKEKLKKQKLEEARNEEKKYRLKLIASGILPDNPNLVKMQEKIFSEILTPSNQLLIDKLDDELISYVYRNKTDKNIEKEETKREKKDELDKKENFNKLPSMEVMKSLCHYKMYHNLMSDDYKEFLLHSKKLLFNNPQKEKNSLEKIQKYLNRKMEIGTTSISSDKKKNEVRKSKIKKKSNKTLDKDKSNLILKTDMDTNISTESNLKMNKLYYSMNQYVNNADKLKFNNKLISESKTNENQGISNNIIPKNKNDFYNTYRSPKHSYIISKEKDAIHKDKDNAKNMLIYPNYTNSGLNRTNYIQRPTISNLRKHRIKTPKAINNRKVDKFIFNKKYFNQLLYFENLISKELTFQKIFLEQKNANSKLFFKGYQTELDSMGVVPREEMLNHFLMLNDKATSKERNYEKEMKLELEFKNKPKVLGNMYKSVSRKIKEGKQIKNAVGKVIDKYILQQKKAKGRRKQLPDKNKINKNNEFTVLKFNDNIKQINYLLTSKRKEIKNIQKKLYYKDNNNLNLTQGKEYEQ